MRPELHRVDGVARRGLRAATSVAAVALVAAALFGDASGTARASVPTGTPTFSAPTVFTNAYFPFTPGAVKVYSGREDGKRATGVDVYRDETRSFTVNSVTFPVRILREYAFDNGELVEVSHNHFAQADDGTVYYFGEVVDIYENGAVTSHDGSWLVGGPAAGDPPETMSVAAPAVFMPASPAAGDVYRPEDVSGGPQETDTVRRVGRVVKTHAGRFAGCIEVQEVVPGERPETKWYAPGVGVVKSKTVGEALQLDSSTLRHP